MVEVADTYKTIDSPAEGIYKEKGSKFLAKAYPVRTEEQVKAIVEQLKEEYYDARHHCYAYILGPKGDKWRANDDGEPSGTAGRPIYGQILSKDRSWTVDAEKMALTNQARFMHCLPVRRNMIVTDEVIDSPASIVIPEAANREWSAQAVLKMILESL